jgi:hypothetical protein
MAAIFGAEWVAPVRVLSEGPLGNELEVGLLLVPGASREQELNPVELVTVMSANNLPLRTAPYTTTNFLPNSRLRLRFKNKTGTSGTRTGAVSFWLLTKAWVSACGCASAALATADGCGCVDCAVARAEAGHRLVRTGYTALKAVSSQEAENQNDIGCKVWASPYNTLVPEDDPVGCGSQTERRVRLADARACEGGGRV